MNEQSWSDYLGSEADSDASAEEPTATDDTVASDLSDASAHLDAGADDLDAAATAQDWASWNDATADEQSADALRYLDSADTYLQEGFDEAAAQDLGDAGMEEGAAAGSTATAADYSDTAMDYTEWAQTEVADDSAEITYASTDDSVDTTYSSTGEDS